MKPKATVRYQIILRAIGQGLENLKVDSFDLLEASNNHYVVAGSCNQYKSELSRKKSLVGFFLNGAKRKTSRTGGLHPFHFTGLRFTGSDIEFLDRKGKALRSSGNSCPPNPYSIAHVLRITGAYLDHNASRLLRLSWQHQILTLWHFTKQGVEIKEELTLRDLYEVWVHQFKKREPIRVLKPTGSN